MFSIKRVFLVFFTLVIITTIALSVVGNRQRTGYISEFNLDSSLTTSTEYIYHARIKYLDKVFRNNDIYGVYPLTDNLPEYIKFIKWNEVGSPFGFFSSTKELTLDDKVENINYTLKVKTKVIFVIVILFILSLILLTCNRLRIFFIEKWNLKKAIVIYFSVLLLVTISIIILGITGNKARNVYLDKFEIITSTKAGYVYRGYIRDSLLKLNYIFNFYRVQSSKYKKDDHIINYGYLVEFSELPEWYDTKNSTNWKENDDSIIFSNSYTYNAFNYQIPIVPNEEYNINILANVLKSGNDNMIRWDISDSRNFGYISLQENGYKKLTGYIKINKNNIDNRFSKKLHINFPKDSIIQIKSISIEQIDNMLLPKKDGVIVFTSNRLLNSFDNFNIEYKLKINKSILILIAIFWLIFVYLLNMKHCNRCIINISNVFIKKYVYIVIALVILFIFLRLSYVDILGWDTTNYIANGMWFTMLKKSGFLYPGTLYSIVNTFLSASIFRNTQFSSFIWMQIIPLSLTIIFTYKILRLFTSKINSIIYILLIFYIYSIPSTISHMLIIPYTDGWLLMFCVLTAYSLLKDNVLLAGIFAAIAHYYRASQALPILIFAVVLLKDINIKKIIIYYAAIFIGIFLIQNVMGLLFNINYNDFDNYTTGMSDRSIKIPFTALNIKDIFLDIINVFWAFKISTILIAISLIVSLIGFIKVKDNSLRKISVFAVLTSASCFAGGLYIQQIFGSRDITLQATGENRYFIYALLFSTLAAFIYIAHYLDNKNTKILNTIKKYFILIIALVSIIISISTTSKIGNFITSIRQYDYSEDYPEIEYGSNCIYADVLPHGNLDYIFKPGTLKYVLQKKCAGWNTYETFMTNDNSDVDYVFGVFSVKDNKFVIDDSGMKFIKIWQNSIKGALPYTLFKKEEKIKTKEID